MREKTSFPGCSIGGKLITGNDSGFTCI